MYQNNYAVVSTIGLEIDAFTNWVMTLLIVDTSLKICNNPASGSVQTVSHCYIYYIHCLAAHMMLLLL